MHQGLRSCGKIQGGLRDSVRSGSIKVCLDLGRECIREPSYVRDRTMMAHFNVLLIMNSSSEQWTTSELASRRHGTNLGSWRSKARILSDHEGHGVIARWGINAFVLMRWTFQIACRCCKWGMVDRLIDHVQWQGHLLIHPGIARDLGRALVHAAYWSQGASIFKPDDWHLIQSLRSLSSLIALGSLSNDETGFLASFDQLFLPHWLPLLGTSDPVRRNLKILLNEKSKLLRERCAGTVTVF